MENKEKVDKMAILSKKVYAGVQADVDASLAGVKEGILDNRLPNNRMPADTFKEKFLPYMNGTKEIGKTDTVISDWITIAGGQYEAVDIVGKDGSIITTVPGAFTSINTENKELKNIPLGKIGTMFTALESAGRPDASLILIDGLDMVEKAIAKDVVDLTPVSDKINSLNKLHPIVEGNLKAKKDTTYNPNGNIIIYD